MRPKNKYLEITMNYMENYSIRVEEERDYLAVESLVRESFWNVYKPGICHGS